MGLEYVNNRAEAEDAVTDVFVRLLDQTSLGSRQIDWSYLAVSVRNRARDIALHKQKALANRPNIREFVYNDGASPMSTLGEDSLAVRLDAAIGELPPKCRLAFELVRIEGLTYRQAAVQMQVSEKAIEGHMTRAYANLRNRLERAWQELRRRGL